MAPRLPAVLALTALLAAPGAFGEVISASADLSGQFPSDKRDQCKIGACHTFTSIALLEAGLKRKFGKEIRLSEADLFVRKTVVGGGYKVMVFTTKKGLQYLDLLITEGGDPFDDLRFAIENGVATQASAPWDKFIEEYSKFKSETSRSCSLAYQKSLEALAAAQPGEAMPGPAQCLGEPSFRAFLDSVTQPGEDGRSRIESRLLGGDPVTLSGERGAVKDLAKDFTVGRKSWDTDPSHFGDRDLCRAESADRKDLIVEQLKAGRPVSLCLRIEGLKGWNHRFASEPLKHCFAVTGFDMDRKGVTLASRNSWGDKNPTLKDRDFCRIHQVVTVEP